MWRTILALLFSTVVSSSLLARPIELPDTPGGKLAAEILDVINDPSKSIDPSRFEAEFLEYGKEKYLPLLNTQLREYLGQLEIVSLEINAEDNPNEQKEDQRRHNFRAYRSPQYWIRMVCKGSSHPSHVQIQLSITKETSLIKHLSIYPKHAVDPVDNEWHELVSELSKLATKTALIARVDSSNDPIRILFDRPRTIFSHSTDTLYTIGTNVKMYVLGALVRRIQQGDATWQDTITIQDDLKSLSVGDAHALAEGTTLTLIQIARLLQVENDFTALDHAIKYLNKCKVGDFMVKRGAGWRMNRPFLSTRENFTFKLNPNNDLTIRFVSADLDESIQNEIVDSPEFHNLVNLTMAKHTQPPTLPLFHETIGWFSSAYETDATMRHLHMTAIENQDNGLLNLLTIDPGFDIDTDTWNRVLCSFGEEAGVMSLNWVFEHKNGDLYSISLIANDTSTTPNREQLMQVAQRAAHLLANYEFPSK